MNRLQLTRLDALENPPQLTPEALCGIDRALSNMEQRIREAIAGGADPQAETMAQLIREQWAAQAWLMGAVLRFDDQD